jgi:hypothetical protein
MNKKIVIFMMSFFAIALLGTTCVYAEQDNIEKGVPPKIVPVSVKANTLNAQTESVRTLRDLYEERLRAFEVKSTETQTQENKIEIEKKERLLKEEAERLERQEKLKQENSLRQENMSDVSKERIDEKQEKIEERKIEMEEKREEIKGKLAAERRERIKQQTERILENFEKNLQKIEEITTKTKERITTMEERGIDLTEAKLLIENVPIKIAEARQSIVEIEIAFNKTLDSETPIDSYRQAKELVEEAKIKIKEAHQSLIRSINAIKSSIKFIQERQNDPESTTEEESGDNSDSE